jgi:hypothetical protein
MLFATFVAPVVRAKKRVRNEKTRMKISALSGGWRKKENSVVMNQNQNR